MIVRPWTSGDTDRIQLQPAQQYLRTMVDNVTTNFQVLSDQGLAWTAEHDGRILGIAGLLPQWENRAIAWALLADNLDNQFLRVHGAVKRFIESSGYRRIEATVDVGFPEGEKWIRLLGFEYEGLMRGYRPDGADILLYARVVK